MNDSNAAGKVTEMPQEAMPEVPTEQGGKRGTIFLIGLYVLLLNLVLVYLLIVLWPRNIHIQDETVKLLLGRWWQVTLGIELQYLLIVALSGALGSYIHLATSFADFVGNQKLVSSWTWWYVLRPFIGTALALVVYFVVRAGLISGASGTESMSPYGTAATAAMCGLFSKQAIDKLREVFENLFRTQKETERADPLARKPEGGEGKAA